MGEKQLSGPEIAGLCRSLSLLLHAGIGLGDGLSLQAEEEEGELQLLFKKIGQTVDAGGFLSDAVEECGRFPVYVSGMIKVGEQTGRLEEALKALADYYEEQEKTKRQIKSALTYPLILFGIMLLIVGVLLIRVLPVFEEVYASLGSGLTGLAGGLHRLGQFLKAALPGIGILLLVLIALVLLFFRNAAFQGKVLFVWRNKWGDRGALRKRNDAHFAQALSMGMRSGMMPEEAVELAGALLRDIPGAALRCQDCAKRLRQGENLAQALKETEVLPPACCRMLELGMRGGSADEVMEDIAKRLSEEAELALEQRVSRIEPIIVMVSSLLVGVILLAVMLPLLDIMSAIG